MTLTGVWDVLFCGTHTIVSAGTEVEHAHTMAALPNGDEPVTVQMDECFKISANIPPCFCISIPATIVGRTHT
jgi:hypothetical protein